MALSRRDFLVKTGAAGLTLGIAGSVETLFTANPAAGVRGPTTATARWSRILDGILDLPRGFSYRILSREGEPMKSGGGLVPSRHDGMGNFARAQRTHLVRNHEANPDAPHKVPTAGLETTYDPGAGGGTTTLVLSPSLRTQQEYVSLGGTAINCSGGITPWRTWLTCEETEDKAGVTGYTKDHGWIFEVHPYDNRRNADPFPLKDMGRFMHEAVAVDPETGILYETEDAFSGAPLGSYYRFLPNQPLGGYGSLRAGGTLQALHVPGLEDLSTVQEVGTTLRAASSGSTSPIPRPPPRRPGPRSTRSRSRTGRSSRVPGGATPTTRRTSCRPSHGLEDGSAELARRAGLALRPAGEHADARADLHRCGRDRRHLREARQHVRVALRRSDDLRGLQRRELHDRHHRRG